jgi:glycerate 2-kinase
MLEISCDKEVYGDMKQIEDLSHGSSITHLIRNYSEAGRTEPRRKALGIFLQGIAAVLPQLVIPRAIHAEGEELVIQGRRYDITKGNVYVIGGGKAAGMMAKVVESVVHPARITSGIVVDKSISVKPEVVRVLMGGHPIPNEEGVFAVREMLRITESLRREDLVICVLSGGGSALLAWPAEDVPLADMETLNRIMLASGMPVHEMNIVRKHISRISGGRLAKLLQPARVITLVISDTFDHTYDATASGPTAPDKSTYEMAVDVLLRYCMRDRVPKSIVDHLEKGRRGEFPETVRPGDPIFNNVQNILIAKNSTALEAMRQYAISDGYNAIMLSSPLTGDVRSVARIIAEALEKATEPNTCLIAGGEPTVMIKGRGNGGRCQELAALVSKKISGLKQSVFIAAGTDGSDFLPDVDGAIVDDETLLQATNKGLEIDDFIERNDTYIFHKELKNLIITGPTNTNVSDLIVFLRSNPT